MLEINLGQHEKIINQGLEILKEKNIIPRIWNRDYKVWKPNPDEISNRLGWLNIVDVMRGESPCYTQISKNLHADGFTHALLPSMGGSSLAPEVFSNILGNPKGLKLSILDSTDPDAVLNYAENLDLEKTLFIVSTKSSRTVETLSFFKYFYNRVMEIVGNDKAGRQFIAITDPDTNLVDIASPDQYNFRYVFENDPNIGGRYSALSCFGLVPATIAGADVSKLLQSAETIIPKCEPSTPLEQNPGAVLGAILGEFANNGLDKATFVVSDELTEFPNWIEQLIAESTGKEGKGILPVVGEALGKPECYQKDRYFINIRMKDDLTYQAKLDALVNAGFPVIQMSLDNVYDLGQQIFLWEFATAVAGYFMEINPFDQPNVESAKVLARKMVAEYTEKGALPEGETAPLNSDVLHNFLTQIQSGDYIALQAFINPTPESEEALQALRLKLRDTYNVATTLGFGPRFLHSTGQLHKGDAGNGVFIQLTSDPIEDADIPDEAGKPESAITFGTLISAQALGDGQALLDEGRRFIRFHLGHNIIDNIKKLSQSEVE
jgi:glucose-6-phosphate isomerase